MFGRLWRPRFDVVLPSHVALQSGARLRLRVQGAGFGFLLCGTERRWVVGRFDEAFLVDATTTVRLAFQALSGRVVRDLTLRPKHRLDAPGVRLAAAPKLAPVRHSGLVPRPQTLPASFVRLPRIRVRERLVVG